MQRRPADAGRASLRLDWTRGESNPRPETTRVVASTCLSGVFSEGLSSFGSRPPHRASAPFGAVQTSKSHLINNVRSIRPACDFRLTTRRLGRHAEAVCIRQPCGPEHRSRCGRRLQRHRWQFLGCSRLIRNRQACRTEPSEHLGHATTTDAIRSKPVAPVESNCQRTASV